MTIHTITPEIGEDVAKALGAFHAFACCDQVSFFATMGRETVWNTWIADTEVIDALAIFPIVQRFVCLLYDKTSTSSNVNDSRKELFTYQLRLFHQQLQHCIYTPSKLPTMLDAWGPLHCQSQWRWLKAPTDSYEPFCNYKRHPSHVKATEVWMQVRMHSVMYMCCCRPCVYTSFYMWQQLATKLRWQRYLFNVQLWMKCLIIVVVQLWMKCLIIVVVSIMCNTATMHCL